MNGTFEIRHTAVTSGENLLAKLRIEIEPQSSVLRGGNGNICTEPNKPWIVSPHSVSKWMGSKFLMMQKFKSCFDERAVEMSDIFSET